jgi:hypothetical protein
MVYILMRFVSLIFLSVLTISSGSEVTILPMVYE